MPIKTDVLILGGGLAGLSTAYHLNRGSGLSSLIVEKNAAPGGTAGSVVKDGFVFDHTGHLLHLHDPYGKKLVCSLLRGNLLSHQRSSWIYSHGAYTRYPFQANTNGLPPRAAEECAAEFLKTIHYPRPPAERGGQSFKDWCLETFGAGISRRFMIPYNEKLWRIRLDRLTTEWQGRFVPKPTAAEVLRGALIEQTKPFGYNAFFRYPRTGGSQALADALAARLRPGQLRLSSPVMSVDARERIAVVQGIGEVSYSRLVNTLALNDFIALSGPWPAAVHDKSRDLRCNAVYCLNLGVARPRVSEKHWIYFPEKSFPFYRVGFYSNFSPENSPPGTSSLYVETAWKSHENPDVARLERAALSSLRTCGILKPADRIIVKSWARVRRAYVVYDFKRTPAVSFIFPHLRKSGIESIGRYGAWKYSFMEETILDGKRCAERLSGTAFRESAESGEELRPLK
ncbi:MAG: protoporphyrinogen/coproporphyrinogen oxidase [Elusimicrobiota bacterium]